jgi:hypothetical protein
MASISADGAYRHAFAVGFISLMIMGIAGRVLPILAGVVGSRISSLCGPFLLINLGYAGRFLSQVAMDFSSHAYPFLGMLGFVEFVALSWWGTETWQTIKMAHAHSVFAMLPAPSGFVLLRKTDHRCPYKLDV